MGVPHGCELPPSRPPAAVQAPVAFIHGVRSGAVSGARLQRELWEEEEEEEGRAEMRWEPRRALSAGSIPSPAALMTQQFITSNLQ